jgi:hypothetical protein
MNELDWPCGAGLATLAAFARPRLDARKARLFAVACCRRLGPAALGEWGALALAVAERFAEGRGDEGQRRLAAALAWQTVGTSWDDPVRRAVWAALAAGESVWEAAPAALDALTGGPAARRERFDRLFGEPPSVHLPEEEEAAQAGLLRCLAGALFHPLRAPPHWRHWQRGTLPGLAEAIYAEEAFDRLPILGDAFEDAGCDDPWLLGHCRDGGPHARGCWALDVAVAGGPSAAS